jgi:hypothetical protein
VKKPLISCKKYLLEILLQYLAAIIQRSSRNKFWLGHFTLWCFDGGARSAIDGRNRKMIEQLRDKAMQLCAEHGITVRPYAGGWWLLGKEINRVVGELAGLCASDLNRLPVMPR